MNRVNDPESDFQKIYETFRPKILRYLTRLIGEHEAEDITQEVFIKVNQALRTFRGESQLSTWIYRIATNTALDRLRSPAFKQMAQERLLKASMGDGVIEDDDKDVWADEDRPSVDQQLIRKEMNKCIKNFIENLPGDHKTVIVMSEIEGLKNSEIAEVLGVSLDTVKIRLHRARIKLKKELETHCTFYRDEQSELACDLKSAFMEFRRRY
jgi:RNA polymerase sigma-70 factor (ECF subfamily)